MDAYGFIRKAFLSSTSAVHMQSTHQLKRVTPDSPICRCCTQDLRNPCITWSQHYLKMKIWCNYASTYSALSCRLPQKGDIWNEMRPQIFIRTIVALHSASLQGPSQRGGSCWSLSHCPILVSKMALGLWSDFVLVSQQHSMHVWSTKGLCLTGGFKMSWILKHTLLCREWCKS